MSSVRKTSSIENYCDDVELSLRRLAKCPGIGTSALDTMSTPYLIVPKWENQRVVEYMNKVWRSVSMYHAKQVFRSNWGSKRFSAHVEGTSMTVEMVAPMLLHNHVRGIREALPLLCLNKNFGELEIKRGLTYESTEAETKRSLYEFSKYFDLYLCVVETKEANDVGWGNNTANASPRRSEISVDSNDNKISQVTGMEGSAFNNPIGIDTSVWNLFKGRDISG